MNCIYIDIVSYMINNDNDIEIYLNRDGIVNLSYNLSILIQESLRIKLIDSDDNIVI